MIKSKIKILFLIESMSSGGKERRLLEILKGISNIGNIKFKIILSKEIIHYKEINKFKPYILKRNKYNFFYSIISLRKQINRFEPDIIHCFGHIEMLQLLFLFSSKTYKIINSTISTSPEKVKFFSKLNFINKLTFPISDMIIANSASGLNSYGLKQGKNTLYIYNGYDFSRNSKLVPKNKVKEKFHINTKLVIAMVASFSDKKDYKTYIKSAIKIIDDGYDVTFLCIGGGDDSVFKTKLDDKYLRKIKFLGSQEDVESIINICNIGVLATFTEGISNALMEFMALSKPVVATKGGGTSELVADNSTGYLVEVSNVTDLYEKLIYLINNPSTALNMGKKGLQRIESQFSLKNMISRTVHIYKEIMNN